MGFIEGGRNVPLFLCSKVFYQIFWIIHKVLYICIVVEGKTKRYQDRVHRRKVYDTVSYSRDERYMSSVIKIQKK